MQSVLQRSIMVAIMGLYIPVAALAAETPHLQGVVNPAVQGELIKIDDKIFTVKDPSGKERQLTIDQETVRVGVFHQGVYVQAWFHPDGRTESIVAFRKNRDTERELSSRR